MKYFLYDTKAQKFTKSTVNKFNSYNSRALARKRAAIMELKYGIPLRITKIVQPENMSLDRGYVPGKGKLLHTRGADAKAFRKIYKALPTVADVVEVPAGWGKIAKAMKLPPPTLGRLDRIEQQIEMMEKRLDQLFDNTKTVKELLTKYIELQDQLK